MSAKVVCVRIISIEKELYHVTEKQYSQLVKEFKPDINGWPENAKILNILKSKARYIGVVETFNY